MRFKNWTPTYLFTYTLVAIGMRGYYRRAKVEGRKNIPKNKPVFFASNHQNSLIDPCVIAVASGGKPVHFLTRSDVFKNKKVAKILYSLNMLPIYRPRDGAGFQQKNESIFAQCHQILNKSGRIIIFPEGSHDNRKHLRKLKAGVANISFGAIEKYPDLDIQIVPVGLNFSNTKNKWADLFIKYGEPISVQDYVNKDGDVVSLMSDLKNAMSDQMIDFKYVKYYELYNYILYQSKSIKKATLFDEFKKRKQKTSILENWLENKEESVIENYKEKAEKIVTYCQNNGIKPYLLNKDKHVTFFSIILLIIGFPVFIYGWLNNELPYRMPRRVNKLLKDDQFHSSIYLIVGSFLSAIFWLIQTLVFYFFISSNYWWAYLLSLPVTGWLAFRYYILAKKTFGKIRYNKLPKQDKLYAQHKKNHEELKSIIL